MLRLKLLLYNMESVVTCALDDVRRGDDTIDIVVVFKNEIDFLLEMLDPEDYPIAVFDTLRSYRHVVDLRVLNLLSETEKQQCVQHRLAQLMVELQAMCHIVSHETIRSRLRWTIAPQPKPLFLL